MWSMRAAVLTAVLVAGCGGAGIAHADPPPPPEPPKTTMDHDGVYVVGTDIEPGTYTSAGPVDDDVCYWKRMGDLHGDAIIDNAMTKKPQTVLVDATDKAFKTDGCQPWQKTDAVTATGPLQGPVAALIAQAQLRAYLNSINAGATAQGLPPVPGP
ncbi:hypothetical protein [Mycobacterium hubeiense]|uniref:hypothetical protein n=1 Tax=Mycobacterium hubeiense TaxID=1867256 RepID=UPI0018EBE60E|nr:hypothetical protein [Mycobacterium sp. QGD 101]